ncbi:MAG: hypothetical protein B7Y02_06945 [Rhodobacterales bacterium 17-64-5]|nr:MAG: hypothetical protein B7Y02_06945 [Rhodobacterales bacterium 17-64-5]
MIAVQDLLRLKELAQLVLDHRLGQLRAAAHQLERSEGQLQAINAAAAPAELPPVAAGLVEINYGRWADIRRAELNGVIARQRAGLMAERAEATTAFGRLQALRGLAEKTKVR